MISLTVRAFAELIHLPAYAQVRILNEQKYPSREPQIFRIPFYQVALRGIRAYYRTGGDRQQITTARATAAQLNPRPKRVHNERALRAFENSPQFIRSLRPTTLATLFARPISGVELRLQFDVAAEEGGHPRRIFYNFRADPLDPDVAKSTVHIAHWVIAQNALSMPIRGIEYVDLATGNVYSASRQSQRALRLMEENARIIATLWPSI
jgi:hypothetical protein